MSQNGSPYWGMYDDETIAINVENLVPCSPSNPTPCYVVGMFDDEIHYPRLGYVYYYEDRNEFSEAYFVEGTDTLYYSERNTPYYEYYFLIDGNHSSFRPHNQVPEDLFVEISTPIQDEFIYIGTVNTGMEEICGPVVNGVCYSNNVGTIVRSRDYNILALNEG